MKIHLNTYITLPYVLIPEHTGENPDEALLRAWADLKVANEVHNRLAPEMSLEEDGRHFVETVLVHENVIETTQAQTMAGIAARLGFLFLRDVGTNNALAAVTEGKDMPIAELADDSSRLLYDLMRNAERLAGWWDK